MPAVAVGIARMKRQGRHSHSIMWFPPPPPGSLFSPVFSFSVYSSQPFLLRLTRPALSSQIHSSSPERENQVTWFTLLVSVQPSGSVKAFPLHKVKTIGFCQGKFTSLIPYQFQGPVKKQLVPGRCWYLWYTTFVQEGQRERVWGCGRPIDPHPHCSLSLKEGRAAHAAPRPC